MGCPRSAARRSCTSLQSRAQLTLTFLGCRQAKHVDPRNRMRIWSNKTRCLDDGSHWLLEHLITSRSLSSNYCSIDVARTKVGSTTRETPVSCRSSRTALQVMIDRPSQLSTYTLRFRARTWVRREMQRGFGGSTPEDLRILAAQAEGRQ